MHLIMILIALGLAVGLRYTWSGPTGNWQVRWRWAIACFLFPPLLLLMTLVAVLGMGPQGQMGGLQASWFSFWLAFSLLGLAGASCLKLAWQGWRSVRQIRTYPQQDLSGRWGRVLDTPVLFSAQVGFWQPELVVSQGLLQALDQAHLDAVLAHEQGHRYYRDTFWFFWLGWLRTCTAWLPYTEALWQEVLVLRELRADHWAAQQIDPLLLAESLLQVVNTPLLISENFCAAFSCTAPRSRLVERIDALLVQETVFLDQLSPWSWSWVFLTFLPLIALPFHT